MSKVSGPTGEAVAIADDAGTGFAIGAVASNNGPCSVSVGPFSLIPGEDRDGIAYDYLIDVDVAGQSGGYTVSAGLTSNAALIANVSQPFSAAGGAVAAGQAAAASLGSIMDKLCAYWKKKRDENDENAVKPQITLKPANEKLNVGDTTSVEITALDCDDSPLKQRKLNLKALKGRVSFSPDVVTTDSSGKATVQLKALQPGLETLAAEHTYTSIVKNTTKKATGRKPIEIGDPPSGVWRMDIDADEEDTRTVSKSKHEGDSSSTDHESWVQKRSAHVSVLIRADGSGQQFTSGDVVDAAGGGELTLISSIFTNSHSQGGSGRLVDTTRGDATIDLDKLTDFNFQINGAEVNVNGNIPFNGSAEDRRYTAESRAVPCCGTDTQTIVQGGTISFGFGNDQIQMQRISAPAPGKAGGLVYRGVFNTNETSNHPESGEVDTHTRTGTIRLTQLTRSQTRH